MFACADYVVTVCGNADRNCQVLPAGVRKEHWPLSDPAKVRGTDDEIIYFFRASRDEIGLPVVDLLERLKG